MKKSSISPSTISMHYNHHHHQETLSPPPPLPSSLSSLNNAANYYDNQCSSLFGDPVPPASNDFLDNVDNHLYSSLRRNSLRNSYGLLDEFPRYNSFATQRGNPPSLSRQQISSANSTINSPSFILQQQHQQGQQNSASKIYTGGGSQYTNITNLAPEINILPNSSSSSGHQTPIMHHRNQNNNPQEPIDVDSDIIFEPHLMNYKWKENERRSSQLFEEEFPSYPRPR